MKRSELFVHEERLTWEPAGDGIQRKILGYDSSIMMVRVRFKKGSRGILHSHPHRQVTLVEKGMFEVEINKEQKVLKAGDSFFVPPDVTHGVLAMEEGILLDVFTPAREDFLPAT